MKIKFANKDVNIKKLVQGAVVLYYYEVDETPDIYHIHKFVDFHPFSSTVDLVITDAHGKWNKNSEELTWPI